MKSRIEALTRGISSQFHIGKLTTESDSEVALPEDTTESSTFLQRSRWNSASLRSVVQVNHDSALYRFSFPSPNLSLGLPVGQHVFVRLRQKASGAWVQRAYTPVSRHGESGQIDILIKQVLSHPGLVFSSSDHVIDPLENIFPLQSIR
jgi:nitrate reductase (NAD(P)H)